MLPKVNNRNKEIYLDHAATTPVDPAIFKAMVPYFSLHYGNPSSLYKQGMEARAAIDSARKTIAGVIGARPQEIIFTAGGTESCNLAIFGVARMMNTDRKTDKHRARPHIIISAIEHHAVLNPIEALRGEGFAVTVLGVNEDGLVNVSELEKAIRKETVLVSIMYANNEIGTVQPIAEIGKMLARINLGRSRKNLPQVVFHTDACQAAGSLEINVNRLGVDLMSINGSKIYGPKQTGFLFVRNGVNLKPVMYGGGQERNLRSGTENVAGIVGLAKALTLAQKLRNKEIEKLGRLQEYFISKLLKIKGVKLNGPVPHYLSLRATSRGTASLVHDRAAMMPLGRLPNNINVAIDGVEGEALMLYLDSYGVAVSTGSACTTGLADPSHVLVAIGRSAQQAKSSLRLTLGRSNTRQQIDYVLKLLPPLISELRKINNFLS